MGGGEATAQTAPLIGVAFGLGWHMAELYAGPLGAAKPAYTQLPADLPGLGDLDDYELAELSVEQIGAELALLDAPCEQTGIELPSIPQPLTEHGRREEAEVLRRAVFELHLEVLEKLTAADFRLGKAYGLGRALADTTLLPTPKEPASFEDAFNPFRVRTLTDWLDDLEGAFPQYAAAAACLSLEAWVAWVAAPSVDGQPVSIGEGGEELARALHGQGRLWRGLLSGEKQGSDLLAFDDYVAAARGLITRTSRVAFSFLKSWWWIVVPALVAAAAIFWLIFTHLHGSSKTATAVIALLGGLGLSWKGVGASLGKALARIEPPLWDAELKEAVAKAATRTPKRWPPTAAVPPATTPDPLPPE